MAENTLKTLTCKNVKDPAATSLPHAVHSFLLHNAQKCVSWNPEASPALIRMLQSTSSKVRSVKVGHTASACLPRFLWHSSYTIGCARSDWLRGWLCFFQPGGWQAERRISPDCCISQSVRPQFLASVCLDEHHRNNKKMQGRQSSPKMFFFSPHFVGSSLSI